MLFTFNSFANLFNDTKGVEAYPSHLEILEYASSISFSDKEFKIWFLSNE